MHFLFAVYLFQTCSVLKTMTSQGNERLSAISVPYLLCLLLTFYFGQSNKMTRTMRFNVGSF